MLEIQKPEMYLMILYLTQIHLPSGRIIPRKGSEKLKKSRNTLSKKRQDAKEMIRMIEKLPDDKKREVIGIIQGYLLCAETEKKVLGKAD